MKRGYTISSLKDVAKYNLDYVQGTLNSRIFPSKRKTAELLKSIPVDGPKVVIHYDYVYIISRFGMMKSHVQEAILNEVHDILEAGDNNPNIIGLVMHTDFALRKEVYLPEVNWSKLESVYSDGIWDIEMIKSMLLSGLEGFTDKNLTLFYDAYKSRFALPKRCRILLENTTKISPIQYGSQGSVTHLCEYVDSRPWVTSLYGLCFDTEHEFAATGTDLLSSTHFESFLKYYKDNGVNVIVHLNTIPKGVEPSSKKDRHSDTTVFDCSVHDVKSYQNIVKILDALDVPHIREVKEETMLDELHKYENLEHFE